MMRKRVDEVVAAFGWGYSCSMAILSSYGPDFGLDAETAAKIASPFGAGVAKTGEICGAVSGALMVIGLTQRLEDIRDAPSREKVYALSRRFIDEFTARNGSANCIDLVGYDLSDPEQFAEAKEKKIFTTRCSGLVKDRRRSWKGCCKPPDLTRHGNWGFHGGKTYRAAPVLGPGRFDGGSRPETGPADREEDPRHRRGDPHEYLLSSPRDQGPAQGRDGGQGRGCHQGR
jgi:C_GCAxxG_C_C family probable redox protein